MTAFEKMVNNERKAEAKASGLKTFDQWIKKERVVKEGETAKDFDHENKALFSKDQTIILGAYDMHDCFNPYDLYEFTGRDDWGDRD